MEPITKVLVTAALFFVALGVVAIAAATREGGFLFLAFVPLLVVPWVLTRSTGAEEDTRGEVAEEDPLPGTEHSPDSSSSP